MPIGWSSSGTAASSRRCFSPSRGEILVEQHTASSHDLKVGSPLQLRFAKTGEQTLTVGGTYAPSQLIGTNYLVSTGVFAANFTDQLDQW